MHCFILLDFPYELYYDARIHEHQTKSTYLPKIIHVDTDRLFATAKQLFLILFAAPDDDAGSVALSTIST